MTGRKTVCLGTKLQLLNETEGISVPYSLYLKDLGIEHLFKPWFIDRYSMCVLVNLKAVADRQSYVSRIVTFFT